MSDVPELPITEPPARSLRTDTLADSVMILLALTVVQRMVGFGRAMLFCRWLDAESLGQWDMAFSFLLLAAPLSVLAISSSFRRYAEYYRQQFQLRMLVRRTAAFFVVCGDRLRVGHLARPGVVLSARVRLARARTAW